MVFIGGDTTTRTTARQSTVATPFITAKATRTNRVKITPIASTGATLATVTTVAVTTGGTTANVIGTNETTTATRNVTMTDTHIAVEYTTGGTSTVTGMTDIGNRFLSGRRHFVSPAFSFPPTK